MSSYNIYISTFSEKGAALGISSGIAPKICFPSLKYYKKENE